MNIIEFARSHGYPLSPVQKVVLKLFYGIPLDNRKLIQVRGDWDSIPLGTTEEKYTYRLIRQGRCNQLRDAPCRELILSAGRRSGKDYLLVLMMAYETYLLTQDTSEDRVCVMVLGPVHNIASQTLDTFRQWVHDINPLECRLANETRTRMAFQKDRDIEKDGPWKGSRRKARASIVVKTVAARSNNLRGINSAFVGINELAYFPSSSSDDVMDGVEVSLERTGGRSVILSTPSPYREGNTFRKRWDSKWGDPETICLEIPTWEMNPSITKSDLQRHWDGLDRVSFCLEIGGQIMDRLQVDIPLRLRNQLVNAAGDSGPALDNAVVEALEAWLTG